MILVLVTDGRANIPLRKGEDVLEEVKQLCLRLRDLPQVEALVIDSEDKEDLIKFDLPRRIAEWLGGAYYTLESLKRGDVIRLVKRRWA